MYLPSTTLGPKSDDLQSVRSPHSILTGTPLPKLSVYSHTYVQIELYVCLLIYVFINI